MQVGPTGVGTGPRVERANPASPVKGYLVACRRRDRFDITQADGWQARGLQVSPSPIRHLPKDQWPTFSNRVQLTHLDS